MTSTDYLKKIVAMGGLQFLSLIAGFGASILIGRKWGAEGVGLYGLVLAVFALTTVFSQMGTGIGLVKEVASRGGNQGYRLLCAVNKVSFVWAIIVSLLAYFIVTIFIYPDLAGGEKKIYFLCFIAGVPVNIIISNINSYLVGISCPKTSQSIIVIRQVCFASICLLLFYLCESIIWVSIGYLSSLLIVLAYSIFTVNGKNLTVEKKKASTREDLVKLYKYSFPLLFIALITVLLAQLDRFMITTMMGLEDAGLYVIAADPSLKLNIVLALSITVFMPRIVKLFNAKDFEKLNEEHSNLTSIITVLTSIILIGLLCVSREYLGLYGDDFVQSTVVLQILACSQMINVITGPVGKILELGNNQNWSLIAVLVALIINGLLNYLLIPYYGIVGAAVATGTSILVAHGGLAIIVYRKLGVSPLSTLYSKVIFSSVMVVAVSLWLHKQNDNGLILAAVMIIAYLILIYGYVLKRDQRNELTSLFGNYWNKNVK